MWKFKIFLLIGGGLLLAYGGLFLMASLDVSNYLEAEVIVVKEPASAMIFLSFLVCLAGLLGILTGITGRTRVLAFTNFIGMKLAVFPALFFTGVVLLNKTFIMPYLVKMWSYLGMSVNADSNAHIISLLIFAACLQIYHSAINTAERSAFDIYILIHSATRAVFILAFLPFAYFQTIYKITIPEMSVAVFAALYGWYVYIFILIRGKCSAGNSVQMILLTLLCIPALAAYYFAAGLIYRWFGFILNWTVLIPLAAACFLMLAVGYNSKGTHRSKYIGCSVCRICDRTIVGLYEYCDQECLEESKKPVGVQCPTCGKPFTITKQQRKDGGKYYCCKACIPITIYKCGKCGRQISGRYSYCYSCGTQNH